MVVVITKMVVGVIMKGVGHNISWVCRKING